MLVIAALQENQGQPIKASHIVTDVYIKKAIKEEVMSDPVNQLLQIKFDWPVRLANGYRDPHLLSTAMIRYMVVRDTLPPHERCPAWRPIPVPPQLKSCCLDRLGGFSPMHLNSLATLAARHAVPNI